MKIVVLDGYALNPGDLSWDALAALGELTVHDRSAAGEIDRRCEEADAVLTNKCSFPRERIERLTALRYIGVLATGFNIVDVAAARERGVAVTNIPTYGTHSVAQHTIALLLELANRVGRHSADVESGGWRRNPDWSYSLDPSIELAGKTFGVIGFGRIGQQTARIAHAMGMKIVAYDETMTHAPSDLPFEWISLKGLLEESDVVSLHCPLVEDTRGLINAQTLKRMKKTAFLLNASRGPLVVEEDLAEELNSGGIAGAGIDVLNEEPPVSGSLLIGAKNCVITPHMAWASTEARSRLLGMAVENLRAWIDGTPKNVVT